MNYEIASEEIFNRLNEAFTTTKDIIGYDLVGELVKWPGIEERLSVVRDKYWARVSTQEILAENKGFGGSGRQRVTVFGLCCVQLFTPKSVEGSANYGRKLADHILGNAFRVRPKGAQVTFRNARVGSLIPQDKYYMFNIHSEFEYETA